MTNIIQTHQYPSGRTIGWDTDTGGWVPMDSQMLQGSFAGNVGRAAVRGAQEIGQGVQELALPGDELTQLQGQQLQQQRQAAGAAAPWAEAIGNAVPDVAAGIATLPLTGGMSFPAMLGAEAGVGAILGGIRPGPIDERIGRAAVGGMLSIGGAAMAPVAAAGVSQALRLFNNIERGTLSRLAPRAEAAGEQIRAARSGGEGVTDFVTPGETQPAGASVGAAQTPAGELDPFMQEESQVLQRTEQTGGDISEQAQVQKLRERGQRLDMKETSVFGSRAGSPIRRFIANTELNPFADAQNEFAKAHNQGRLANILAKNLDLPNADQVTTIFADNLDDARAGLGLKFQDVESRLPDIRTSDFTAALRTLKQEGGIFDKPQGQKMIADAIEAAQNKGKKLTAEQIMSDRSLMSEQMADFFKNNKINSGEVLMGAINKLDDVIDKRLKQTGKEKLAEHWARARKQWQILQMVDRPGAYNPATGDLNPRTIFSQMRKRPSSGGFGQRPAMGTPERDLYDAVEFAMHNETGMPMTGARALMRSGPGKAIIAGAIGTGATMLGANAIKGMFD